MSSINQTIPPVGTRFERAEKNRCGKVVARRVLELAETRDVGPDHACDRHRLVTVLDEGHTPEYTNAVGHECWVEDQWFEYRTDYRQVRA